MSRQLTSQRTTVAGGRLLTPRFLALALATLAYFTGDGILIAAVPRFVAGPLAAGNVAVGLVVGAFSVSAFFLRPWAGRIGDRFGRRPLMVAGAGLFAVSVLGYALASDPTTLGLLRLVTGAGEALFFVGAVTAFTDLAPPARRGEAMSLASLGLYIGIGAGPLIGEFAIEQAGFTAAWVLAALGGVVALLVALRTPETRPEAVVGQPGRPRLVHPAGLLPGLLLLASIIGMAGFLAFVPLYALDLGMGGSGPVLLAFAGIVVGIRSAGARIPDRLGAGRATRLAFVLSAAGLVTAGVWRAPAGLLAGAVVLGVGIALLTPSVFSLAIERVAPQERAAVIGTTSAFLDLALGLGPALLGFVAAGFGRQGTFLAGAVAAVAGLVLVVAAGVGRPRSTPAPSVVPAG